MEVKVINSKLTYDFLLNIHYAKRIPSISFAFGLFDNEELIGVVTYGKPPASTVRTGICTADESKYVWELNRLCLKYNRKNEASFLVATSLKKLPKPAIIISYADTSQNHLGIVYQACNFIYCGLSAKRTDWKIKGLENLHSQSIVDMTRGQKNRAEWIREKYGSDFYLMPRSQKHRYLYFLGSKKEIKLFKQKLKYKIQNYPKGITWNK